jgi:uncharacterized membrane protein
VSDWVARLFALVCGQDPLHTWAPGGELLPFCQRCTGFYAGATLALVLQLALRMQPSARFLQVHGAFLLLMIPFGFHWLPQGALVRTLLGLVYGFGVVSFLWLFPGTRLPGTRPGRRADTARYAGGVTVALVAVPALAVWGGAAAARALVILAVLGLAGLATLAAANVSMGLFRLATWPRRFRNRLAS